MFKLRVILTYTRSMKFVSVKPAVRLPPVRPPRESGAAGEEAEEAEAAVGGGSKVQIQSPQFHGAFAFRCIFVLNRKGSKAKKTVYTNNIFIELHET